MYFSKTWTENLSGSPEKHPPSPHGSTRVLACFVRSELRAAGKRTINVPICWSVRPSVRPSVRSVGETEGGAHACVSF